MILDLLNWGLKLGVVTTGLIGLALLLRRPLARYWGAEAAYLIWALPFLRLFMPDIQLPIKQKLSVWEWPEITAVPFPAKPVETLEAPFATTAQSTPLGLDLSALPILIVGIWLSVGLTWFVWQLYKHVCYWRLLNHVCLPVNDEIANVCLLYTSPSPRDRG